MNDSKPVNQELAGFVAAASAEDAMPSSEPPAGAITAGDGGITAWVNNQKINALWSINENRNSWVGVAGIGWRKLVNNSDSAIVALTILGTNAKQTQGPVNYRQEADGMIYEMYVW